MTKPAPSSQAGTHRRHVGYPPLGHSCARQGLSTDDCFSRRVPTSTDQLSSSAPVRYQLDSDPSGAPRANEAYTGRRSRSTSPADSSASRSRCGPRKFTDTLRWPSRKASRKVQPQRESRALDARVAQEIAHVQSLVACMARRVRDEAVVLAAHDEKPMPPEGAIREAPCQELAVTDAHHGP